MKAKINYKSKKAIIIAIIIIALIVISALAVGVFLKGNNQAEATGNNEVSNNVVNTNKDNTAGTNTAGNNTTVNNTTGNNTTGNTDNTNINNTPQNTENNQQNTNNQNEANNNQQGTNNQNEANNNQQNTNNQNNTQNQGNTNNTNIPNQEFVTERIEIIPERVIAENYFVSWEPTQFETLISGEISLEKAKIVAQKTVAKVTLAGLEQNPESVKVGETLKYTITLTNTSSKVNGIINVTDTIPAGTEFISATGANLKTTPAQYENSSEVTKLEWKNVKVKAESEVKLEVYVKVVAKAENADTTVVQNIAKIYDGTTPEENVPSPETKVANITASKTSTIIYNEAKPHEHIVVGGIEPLHEQDIIEYTILLTNVGEAAGTVTVSDTVPEGTTFIDGGVVTVVDKNGTTTYQMQELVEGIEVTVPETSVQNAGIATVTFRVIVDSFNEETKIIRNDMAKVDGSSTNITEDEAEKLYIDIPVTKVWENLNSDAAKEYAIDGIKLQLFANGELKAEQIVVEEGDLTNGIVGDWKYTFTNFPKYDEQGKIIKYTVGEAVVNSQDEAKLDKYITSIDQETGIITNTFDTTKVQDEKTQITIKKVWEDNLNKYNTRPNSVTLTVNGTNYELTGSKIEKEWTKTVELAKYDSNGNLITYTATENSVPTGYTKTENGLTVTNTADVIVEKTAYKANTDGSKGIAETESDVFGAGDIIYYTLTFKNAGNATIPSKTLTDTLSLRLELLAIDSTTEITEDTESGTDNNGYTWTLLEDANGNTVINWTLTNVAPGEMKEITIKTRIPIDVEHRDLTTKYGDVTEHPATLYVRKDGKVPYIGSGLSESRENYTASLGTIYLNTTEPHYNTDNNLINDDIYHLLENNNTIVDMVSRGITRAELIEALKANGITLASDEIVLWYTIRGENDDYQIYGVIKKVSDPQLTKISNAVIMDNIKQDEETINVEEIVIEQSGTVTINVTSTTTETISTPMDVVFVMDVSGSMDGNNASKMVNAVNNSIKAIMSKNPENRIGIVVFSDNAEVLIPLAKYSVEVDYLTHTREGNMFKRSKITENVTGKSESVKTEGATYTQSGIKKGAEMLTSQSVTTFTTTSQSGGTVTGTRTPALVLITDGDPTYSNNTQDLTGTISGNGSDSKPEHYYWTIRTAKYYKDAITEKYYAGTTKQAKLFTIGIGLDSKSATTMLNPNETNVNICKDANENTSEDKNAKSLYNLLNNNQTPYAYDYADKSKTGAISESDLENFLTTSLEASSGVMVVRAITTEETINRRVDLVHMDTEKEFSLEIIGETTTLYNTLSEAQSAGYVKYDNLKQIYYVDLSNIKRETTVNISYYHIANRSNIN